jgi:2,5-diketo-D-gluconate reductase A
VTDRVPPLRLGDGAAMPRLGLGTWPLSDVDAVSAVSSAIETGWRHIVTAAKFGNEVGVGLGIALSGVPRDDLFITVQVDGGHLGGDRTERTVRESFGRLGIERADLLLIHYPFPHHGNYISTWVEFARLRDAGVVGSIGVTDFSEAHVARLVDATGVVPAINQIKVNPAVPNILAREWCAARGIAVAARSPLDGGTELLRHPTVISIARDHDISAAQVVLAWIAAQNIAIFSRATTPDHQAENLAVFDLELSAAQLGRLGAVGGYSHASLTEPAPE